MKEAFLRCHDCGAVTHKNAKTLEADFYSRSKEENGKVRLINFYPLEIAVYLTLFSHCFLIKFLKRYLLSSSIGSNYKSRVSIDPC